MSRARSRSGLAVVDTNVLLVANKKHDEASPECIQACVLRLNEIRESGHIVVDSLQRIFTEYRNKTLKGKGQREAGDEFVLWMITNLWNISRCTQVAITPKPDDGQDFEEFPDDASLASFDRSDRVFVAVANAHPQKPPIIAACDTDYWKCRKGFSDNGITIDFICQADVVRFSANGE